MRAKYVILDLEDGAYAPDEAVAGFIKALCREGIVSYVRKGNRLIAARYGVNKTTLRKLLKRYKEVN